MNRCIFVILTFLFPVQLFAQLVLLSDHYTFNALPINPAFAGCQDALSATIQYRNQWVGFQDAPKSRILSVHAPMSNDRMGLGLLVNNNTTGIYKETSILGNYAYRQELNNGKLALGLGFGVTLYNVAWDELEATDAEDELLIYDATSAVLPDFSLGAYYYTQKYFIGISIPFFLSHVPDGNTGNYKMKNDFSDYNYMFTGGFETDISPVVDFLPSVIVKYHPGHTVQIDYNAQFKVKDRIWIGLGYRNSKMLIGLLQLRINDQLRIAYSFDFDISRSTINKNGSHEILLAYVFSYSRKVISPRQF